MTRVLKWSTLNILIVLYPASRSARSVSCDRVSLSLFSSLSRFVLWLNPHGTRLAVTYPSWSVSRFPWRERREFFSASRASLGPGHFYGLAITNASNSIKLRGRGFPKKKKEKEKESFPNAYTYGPSERAHTLAHEQGTDSKAFLLVSLASRSSGGDKGKETCNMTVPLCSSRAEST